MDVKDCPPPQRIVHASDVPPLSASTVTVVIGTFGESIWHTLAETRAHPSARALGVNVVHVHGTSLHDARNRALAEVTTPWAIHLDADDELEDGYIQAMAAGTADIRGPSVRYVRGSRWQAPYVPKVAGHTHECVADCLLDGSWLLIGSAVLADTVRAVGGWRDFAWSEDWDVFLRCYLAGATVEAIPRAVYRAHVRFDSRNRAPRNSARYAAHKAIAEANGIGMPR